MGTRSDLLGAAEEMARNARSAPNLDRAMQLAAAAKTALEAAKLAADTSESEIDEALNGMRGLLERAGVDDLADEVPAGEFLRLAFNAMLTWRGRVDELEGYAAAYDVLRDRVQDLESDFAHAGTETATRIAGRMRGALGDATVLINQTRRSANGSSTDSAVVDGE